LFTTVTLSPVVKELFTVRAYEPVEDEETYTPELMVKVTALFPATYPGAEDVLKV
jgi:hypothetical protein